MSKTIDSTVKDENIKIGYIFQEPSYQILSTSVREELAFGPKQLKFKKIIYLSCGFESLKSNLKELLTDYKINKAAMFDQFPYTDHIETGVVLRKL